jgi:endonuclease YncB( thermonuclease family)
LILILLAPGCARVTEGAALVTRVIDGDTIEIEGGYRVRYMDRDRYGRLLRYVWVDNTMVDAELVRLGYAYSYSYPPNLKYQTYLLQMEKEAREHKRGLWSSHRSEGGSCA